VTDTNIWRSTSPACNRLTQMLNCAFYRSGHSRREEKQGVTDELGRLLSESGCQHVQTRDYTLELVARTVGGQNFYEIARFGFQTAKPFIQKWDCAPEDYDSLYEQAMIEMQQPDFRVTWNWLPRGGQSLRILQPTEKQSGVSCRTASRPIAAQVEQRKQGKADAIEERLEQAPPVTTHSGALDENRGS
jgi:hypothetical protein